MFSLNLALLLLQASPAILTSAEPVGLSGGIANNDAYSQLQELFDSARSTAVDALQKRSGSCNGDNVRVRREWDAYDTDEKKDYIRAVKCLQSRPARTPSELGTGIKTRYDDFIATHMNQTNTIHYTATFLSWHRYYIHLFEEALRDECGYRGSLPYWNWPKTAITGLHASPIFDGSETSLSGDGYFIPNKSDINAAGNNPDLEPFWVPAGSGGGCVKSGPFAKYTLNLGPVGLALPGGVFVESPHNGTGIFSWNPRCLKRDLTDYINQHFANASSVMDVVQLYDDVATFQLLFQGWPAALVEGGTTLGVHGGGHFSLGGDPGRDLYVSPGDPAFYLHHSMMDRVWWLWQMQDPDSRVWGNNSIAGTGTFLNNPPSPNVTVEDYVEYGYAAGPPKQIKDLLSTTAGAFCYIYE